MDSSAAITREQHIDARRARQHVAYKSFVPRHIHKPKRTPFSSRKRSPDHRDSAALLFGKTIRVRARQRFDQRRFAVVDVPAVPTMTALHRSGHIECAEIPLPLWMLLEERIRGQTQVPIRGGDFIDDRLALRHEDRAARIGLANDKEIAPARIASAGVAFRAWSSELDSTAESLVERRASRSGNRGRKPCESLWPPARKLRPHRRLLF